jgi:protein-serine/threonine kinase
MYEMLIGYPPFCSDNYAQTYQKIINWREHLKFPEDLHVSPGAEHLIRRLLCDSSQRLGLYGADEVKAHPFFKGIDWNGIRKQKAPFIPQLKSIIDTTYFPADAANNESDARAAAASGSCEQAGYLAKQLERRHGEEPPSASMVRKKDLAFVGYSFRRFETLKF